MQKVFYNADQVNQTFAQRQDLPQWHNYFIYVVQSAQKKNHFCSAKKRKKEEKALSITWAVAYAQ